MEINKIEESIAKGNNIIYFLDDAKERLSSLRKIIEMLDDDIGIIVFRTDTTSVNVPKKYITDKDVLQYMIGFIDKNPVVKDIITKKGLNIEKMRIFDLEDIVISIKWNVQSAVKKLQNAKNYFDIKDDGDVYLSASESKTSVHDFFKFVEDKIIQAIDEQVNEAIKIINEFQINPTIG